MEDVELYRQPQVPARRGGKLAEYFRLKRQALRELPVQVARDRFVAKMAKVGATLSYFGTVVVVDAATQEWPDALSVIAGAIAGSGVAVGITKPVMPIYAPFSIDKPEDHERYERKGAFFDALPHKKQLAKKIDEIEVRESGVENPDDL